VLGFFLSTPEEVVARQSSLEARATGSVEATPPHREYAAMHWGVRRQRPSTVLAVVRAFALAPSRVREGA